MSDDSKGGASKKLSTKDILAAARAQAAKAGGGEAAPAAAESAESAATAPVAEKPVAKPAPPAKSAAGGKPKSTADILAAARAQATGGAAAASAEAPAAPAAKPPAPAKPVVGGKPKSTADILAAARSAAGKGGAPTAPAAEAAPGGKPAAKEKPKAPAKAAPAAAEGPKLSVQEMLAAVRPTAVAEAGAAPAAARPAGAAPMPLKPTPVAARTPAPPPDTTRRSILLAFLLSPFILIGNLLGTAYAAAWTMLAATTGIATLATARFMLPNVLTEPPSKFKIGPAADFDLGTVATRFVATNGVWIVHTDGYKGKNLIYALISVCTHLGCTPSWLEGERKFKCPCHGSGFYITGVNFEGPAPRPLERAGIRIAEDGMLEVDKSVKFQEEMGQWNDPASYYEVVG